MGNLSQKELDIISNKILENFDWKNPSTIFKDKIKITNVDALAIQSNVAKLRENKGYLILTGAYGFPVPIKDKKLIEVTSSAFGDVNALFN